MFCVNFSPHRPAESYVSRGKSIGNEKIQFSLLKTSSGVEDIYSHFVEYSLAIPVPKSAKCSIKFPCVNVLKMAQGQRVTGNIQSINKLQFGFWNFRSGCKSKTSTENLQKNIFQRQLKCKAEVLVPVTKEYKIQHSTRVQNTDFMEQIGTKIIVDFTA